MGNYEMGFDAYHAGAEYDSLDSAVARLGWLDAQALDPNVVIHNWVGHTH